MGRRRRAKKKLSSNRKRAESVMHAPRERSSDNTAREVSRRRRVHVKGVRRNVRTTTEGVAAVATASTAKRTTRKKPISARVLFHPTAERRPTRHGDTHPLDRAIAELRGELARTPEDATLLGRLAALYYRRGDLQKAENHYRRALELAPQRPSLHNNLGNVLCDLDRMREGIAEYEYALALEKNSNWTRGRRPRSRS